MTTLDKIRQLDRELDWLRQKAYQHPDHWPQLGNTDTTYKCPNCGLVVAMRVK